jgi:hypothetical protein
LEAREAGVVMYRTAPASRAKINGIAPKTSRSGLSQRPTFYAIFPKLVTLKMLESDTGNRGAIQTSQLGELHVALTPVPAFRSSYSEFGKAMGNGVRGCFAVLRVA